MSRRVTLVAVTLPLLAIAFGIVRAQLFLRHADDFVLEVGGYDPRDLLRGHYLRFLLRVDPLRDREPCDESSGQECCLCLMHDAQRGLSVAERATCDTARTQCDGVLTSRALSESYRYYVPEDQSAELERRLQEAMQHRTATAVVAVDAGGGAQVRELRIDGEAIPGGIER
jgi:uncharacterized membrane-anchored protein